MLIRSNRLSSDIECQLLLNNCLSLRKLKGFSTNSNRINSFSMIKQDVIQFLAVINDLEVRLHEADEDRDFDC